MADYDIVIRGGTIVDGSGSAPRRGDVAISGNLIVRVGEVPGSGTTEIDAAGRYVTPGFVDVHSHYDGQVTWEHTLAPSSNHGVTTVITGNCGVGFAPCRPGDRDALIKVMEGVEDIPEVVMSTGIPWDWETFPEYMDAVEARSFDVDVGVQIAHSPIRVFVMGERGINHEASSELDRKRMADLVTEAVAAGAIGISTSRSLNHRAKDGQLAPSVQTADDEVYALAEGLRRAGSGVFQIIPEMSKTPEDEFAVIERVARICGRPVSFSLAQTMECPDNWRRMLDRLEVVAERGLPIKGQVFPRPIGVMMGLQLSLHPLLTRPSFKALAHLPLPELVAELRKPETKARILSEEPVPDPQPVVNMLVGAVGQLFELGEVPNYMPDPETRLSARAEREGRSALDLAYDLMLEQDGKALLYLPSANFGDGSNTAIRRMLDSKHTILGLADGGAHYGMICDAGYPSFVLTHWVRDAGPDQGYPIEWAVAELSRKPALAMGLSDRGLVAPGCKADLNVIDLAAMKLHPPRVSWDLPAGGRRLAQEAEGYVATIVSGVVTRQGGKPTGALPGRLIRANQGQPEALAG